MQVTAKGQVTIPKDLRDAAGVRPGSRVEFFLDRGMIVIRKTGTGKDDRRAALRAAATKVRKSLAPSFRQMSANDIMAFLRPEDDRP